MMIGMRLVYEYRKFKMFGTEYNTSDETDMRIFVDDITTEFRKLEQENKLLKSKLDNIKELLGDC